MHWAFLALIPLAALAVGWRLGGLRARRAAQTEIQRLQRSHQEAALQIQAQQDAVFNSMADGLLLLDRQGRVQLANRAFRALFEITADIRSLTVMEALRLHQVDELVSSLPRHKQVLGFELELPGLDKRWLEINAAAIFDPDGRHHGAILVFHDLTQLKQLENTRKDFVANVSHELRTPLSLIKGYVETLLDGAQNNPDVATKFLRTIDRNAERLKLLIEDLLTLSELESGRVTLHLQPVSLRPVVDKVLSDFKARADARRIQLTAEIPDLNARADPDRLEQVIGNLIDNAIKYGKPEGKVVVTARPANGAQVEVSVQDDGPGIPPAALERVFERFYRVDKARSREQGGTGLGLAIVKHLVQSHGGKVWARSDLGHGAAFSFTIPRDAVGVSP
jgi:two-component system, OmpR family, phosphate regulon sensor histidine kinase PhoR